MNFINRITGVWLDFCYPMTEPFGYILYMAVPIMLYVMFLGLLIVIGTFVVQ